MSLKEDAIYDQDGKFLGYLNCPVDPIKSRFTWRGAVYPVSRLMPWRVNGKPNFECDWHWKLEDRMTALILVGLGALRLEEQNAE